MERRYNFLPERYQNPNFSTTINSIYQTEGFRGFFRGFWPYMIVNGPGSAVWWASYELCKRFLHQWRNNYYRSGAEYISPLNSFLSGGFAGVISCIVTNPLDVARTRIQLLEVQNQRERERLKMGFTTILKEIFAKEGLWGLYKGIKPRIFIRAPGSALAFVGYEILKENCAHTD